MSFIFIDLVIPILVMFRYRNENETGKIGASLSIRRSELNETVKKKTKQKNWNTFRWNWINSPIFCMVLTKWIEKDRKKKQTTKVIKTEQKSKKH